MLLVNDFKIVIPARYASTRFPAKPLVDLCGKPLLQHVHECALKSGAVEVVIATDDQRIFDAARKFGADVVMTSSDHQSGTDRIVEVAELHQWHDDEIVVNLQGDEPLTPAEVIQQVATNLYTHNQAVCATLSTPLTRLQEITDPNVVKVVTDAHGYALYFSRAPVPYDRDASISEAELHLYHRHLGIYAYKVGFLKSYASMRSCAIETIEKLEQLRILFHGEKIHVAEAVSLPGHGVDTPEDLEQVRQIMQSSQS